MAMYGGPLVCMIFFCLTCATKTLTPRTGAQSVAALLLLRLFFVHGSEESFNKFLDILFAFRCHLGHRKGYLFCFFVGHYNIYIYI